MKLKATMRLMMLFFALLMGAYSAQAQAPTYELHVSNETLVNPQTYQFDVYLVHTGGGAFELANFGCGIGFNTAVVNGGVVTFSIVPGFSELNSAQTPTGSTFGTVTQTSVTGGVTYRYMNIQPRTNPGTGAGSIISQTGSCPNRGTRIGRFQLANTVAFATNSQMKHLFSLALGAGKANTVVSAYIAGTATTIQNAASIYNWDEVGTCMSNIFLNPPAPCDFTAIATPSNAQCFGGSGSALITLSGVDVTASGTYSIDGGLPVAYNTNPFTISPLGASTYSIAVSNTGGLCTSTIPVTITQPSSAVLAAASSQVDVLCFGSSTGSVTITGSGGTAPYSGEGTFTGLAVGDHVFTVTDAVGCTDDITVSITGPTTAVSGSVTAQTNILCFGNSTGSATVAGAGGTPGYTYSWSPSGGSLATATGLAAGSYSVLITDANGCTATQPVVITEPNELVGSSSFSPIAVCGGSTTVTISSTGGTGTVTGTGAFTQSAGSVNYTITDANGCTDVVNVTLTDPGGPTVPVPTHTNVLCFGTSTGTATVNPSGGTGTYTYVWSPSGGALATATGLAAGTYTVIVTDAGGCSNSNVVTITEPATAVSGSITAQTNVLCFGASTGSATVTAAGGTGAYTYLWSPSGGAAASATGLAAGNYSVLITDANGCTATLPVTITEPATAVSGSVTAQTNVACFSGSTGSATVTAAGGTGAYTYLWSPSGGSVATATGLAAGNYSVLITDASGCTATVPVTITEPTELQGSSSFTPLATCGGTTNVTISATGGTPGYTGTGVFAQGAGSQNYTVTDANGCTDIVTVVVTAPGGPSVSIGSQTNVLCFGSSTGSATVSASAGSSPYTYLWSNGQTSVTAINLAAGSYTVTVTDAVGCSNGTGVTITEPASAVSGSVTSQTNVLCFGASTGTATVAGAGGTGAYSYLWSPTGGTAATATGLAAGNYSVLITDANSCTSSVPVAITEPSELQASESAHTDAACYGANTGSVTITATGGSGPYSGTGIMSGLTAGTYNFTVTDNNGCTDVVTVVITNPSAQGPPTATVTQPTCLTATATITVNTPASGSGITYSINNSDYSNTLGIFSGVAANTSYPLTWKNAAGCVSPILTVVVDPQPATPVPPTITPTNNFNGTYNLTASGYTGSLLWSTGATTSFITISTPGTYTVTVTGSNGCTSAPATYTFSGSVFADPAISSLYMTDAVNGGIDPNLLTFGTPYQLHIPVFNLSQDGIIPAGSTTMVIDLGTKMVLDGPLGTPLGAYFSWTVTNVGGHTILTGDQIGQIPTDFIDELVINVNGSLSCISTIEVDWTVDNHSSTLVLSDEDGSNNHAQLQYGTPVTITAVPVHVTCFGAANGQIISTPSAGASVVITNALNQVVTAPFAPGTYTVTASANNDNPPGGACSASTTVTITEPATAVSASATGTNVLCFNGNTGTATVTPAGGTPGYTYLWNDVAAQTTATATGLTAGTYTVTVTDANGCIALASYTVTQPAALVATATGVNVLCFSNNTGSATASVSGGTAPYTYSWNDGAAQITQTASGLSAGTYTVTVTDFNGCTAQASYTVTQPASALSATATGVNVLCFGSATGSATAIASGGTPGYTYLWSNGGTTAAISGLTAGIYTCTITDANGCTTPTSYTVTQPSAALAASIASTNVSCFAGNNGSATVTASNGTAPYTYSWNTTPVQTTAIASNLTAGSYTVIVTDVNGCTTSASVTITQPPFLGSSGTIVNVSCNGGSNGSATVNPTGGTPGYTYMWSNGQITQTATGLVAGNYSVTITDANGCQRLQVFTITQPAVLTTSATIVNVSCNGGSNGSATALPTGGTAPYGYLWSNGQTTQTATGLVAGSYTVTVTDAKGCTTSATFSVNQPTLLTAVASGTNVNCFGSATGTATALPSGGTAPYSYLWSNGQSTQTATGLIAGSYTVTVTDAKGCTTTASYTVTQSGAALTATSSFTNVVCFGSANGTATVVPSGGTAPYMYSWNTTPVQSTATATGLAPGTYTCTITDAAGCTTSQTVTISQPTGGVTAIASGTNVTCFGLNNGSATVTAAGGTSPYTYLWSPSGGTAATASGLAPGVYSVTVSDANGCSATASYTVTQPVAALASSVAAIVNNTCHFGTDGSISLNTSGGTLPYTYVITAGPTVNASGLNSGIFTSLAAGTYTIQVTDANSCTANVNATITAPLGINPDISLGSDYTSNFFATNGVEQTILYNISELGGNPAIGDTIRIIKPSGYVFTFDGGATNITMGTNNYVLDNVRWKLIDSGPFISLILDPLQNSTAGTLNCGQLVRISLKIKRNTTNIAVFTLSSRLRKCNNEVQLGNNLSSIIFVAE